MCILIQLLEGRILIIYAWAVWVAQKVPTGRMQPAGRTLLNHAVSLNYSADRCCSWSLLIVSSSPPSACPLVAAAIVTSCLAVSTS